MTDSDFAVPTGQRRLPPPPPIGPEQAQRMRFTREEYDEAKGWYLLIWRRHLDADLPGAPGRLRDGDLSAFLHPSTMQAQDELAAAAHDGLDPCLEAADSDLVEASSLVEELERPAGREIKADDTVYTVPEARRVAGELTAEIQRDTDRGFTHHRRISAGWKAVATGLLWLDVAAIVVIFCDILNVDYGDPFAAPPEFFAAVLLPMVLVAVQLWLAQSTGRRFNDHRQRVALGDAGADKERTWAWVWALSTAAFVLPLTCLLVVRFWGMSEDADLGALWQAVLTGLALVIGLGAPLVKVRVVAEDGSTSSRRRDELEHGLDQDRAAMAAAMAEAQSCLDEVSRAHGDYLARLRPEVVFEAGGPIVRAENALGLFSVLIGSATGGPSGLTRRDTASLSADPDFPLLRWTFIDAPEIDNGQLLRRDRTYRAQRELGGQLRDRLNGLGG
jgi:hypothetical protein